MLPLLPLREWLAATVATLILLLLVLAPIPRLAPPRLADPLQMQVTLEQLPPEPEPVPPQPVAPPAPPQPRPPEPVPPVPMRMPPPAPPKPAAPAPVKPLAPHAVRQVSPPPAAAPPAAAPATAAPATPAPVAPAAQTPPPAASATDGAERGYVSGLHSYLDSIKRYPTSREARLERPTGTVVVWFVLDRRGGLAECGVEHSSGSMILDQAALATVRRGEYPAFPGDAWGGAATRRFTVRLTFSLD